MGNLIVGAMVLAIVFLAGRSMYRDHKAGKFICGGDCASCGGSCSTGARPNKKNA